MRDHLRVPHIESHTNVTPPRVLFVALLAVLITACAPSTQPAAESPAQPTTQLAEAKEEEEPTKLPAPTPTPLPEPTALPSGVLFHDDFDGQLQPGWEWVNEHPARRTFTDDGWLEIVADEPGFYGSDQLTMVNFLTRPLPDGDFVVTAHVQAQPLENFHQATIFIFENPSNYVALNTGYCGVCPTGGPGFYMETIIDNNPFGDAFMLPRDPAATDVYLRLVNQGGSITGSYATRSGQWQEAGAFGNFFDFVSVGLGATNSGEGTSQDLVARFDYFEISQP